MSIIIIFIITESLVLCKEERGGVKKKIYFVSNDTRARARTINIIIIIIEMYENNIIWY